MEQLQLPVANGTYWSLCFHMFLESLDELSFLGRRGDCYTVGK